MLNSNSYIKTITDALFAPELRRFAKAEDALSDANQEVTGLALDGFTYQGVFYRHSRSSTTSGTAVHARRALHLSLWPRMDAHLADKKSVEEDRAAIRQMLFRLLEPCFCDADIRDAVPECVVDALPDHITSLQRARSVDFFLRHPRDYRQYERVLPILQLYSAARLIY